MSEYKYNRTWEKADKIFKCEVLCILGYDGGEFECYQCQDEDDAYQILTDRIHDEINNMKENYEENSEELWWTEDMKDLADDVLSFPFVNDHNIILKCFKWFFPDCYNFVIMGCDGEIILNYDPYR